MTKDKVQINFKFQIENILIKKLSLNYFDISLAFEIVAEFDTVIQNLLLRDML
jgi:hypothetical protein